MRWENSNFYPRKYENIHKCRMSVAVQSAPTQDITKDIIVTLSKLSNCGVSRRIFKSDLNELEESDLVVMDLMSKTHKDHPKFII